VIDAPLVARRALVVVGDTWEMIVPSSCSHATPKAQAKVPTFGLARPSMWT